MASAMMMSEREAPNDDMPRPPGLMGELILSQARLAGCRDTPAHTSALCVGTSASEALRLWARSLDSAGRPVGTDHRAGRMGEAGRRPAWRRTDS
jgi:hypothetical protein